MSLVGNRELHEATSALAAWIFRQPFLPCTWNWCITLLPSWAPPRCPKASWEFPGTAWGLGWEWAGYRAPSQSCSLSFHPRNYFCSSLMSASYITLHPPTSNVYAWTSCPGLGFTNQNSDLTCQRHFFSFAPSHPHLPPGQPLRGVREFFKKTWEYAD